MAVNGKEIWKPINNPLIKIGYFCSNLGRIKSELRSKSIIIKPNTRGIRAYYRLQTTNKNRQHLNFHISRLVWETFKGEIPKGYVIDHIDDNPYNNKLTNLQLLTQRLNIIKHHQKNNNYTGVSIDPRRINSGKPYRAYIRIEGKKTFLGRYPSKQEAHEAYIKKLKEISI